MNVLIVGSGAREHALTWKALQSPLTSAVYCAPGNAGTAAIAVNSGLQATDVVGIARFVAERKIGLTVIGPEAAVAAGVADRLIADGRLVFGPTAAAGGMGGYSPVGFFGPEEIDRAVTAVLKPVVQRLRDEGTPYYGCLYAGLMVGPSGVQALEFNARFGDPEAQVVLPRLSGDVVPWLEATARGALGEVNPSWSGRSSVGVVLASRGYPGIYQTGYPVEGLGTLEPDVFAFHAATTAGPAGYLTAGGRVLTLVALG